MWLGGPWVGHCDELVWWLLLSNCNLLFFKGTQMEMRSPGYLIFFFLLLGVWASSGLSQCSLVWLKLSVSSLCSCVVGGLGVEDASFCMSLLRFAPSGIWLTWTKWHRREAETGALSRVTNCTMLLVRAHVPCQPCSMAYAHCVTPSCPCLWGRNYLFKVSSREKEANTSLTIYFSWDL